MSRHQYIALSLLVCVWLSSGVAGAQANPFFFKGTDSGCQYRAAPEGSWQSVDAPKLICGAQMALKTEKGSWGTIVYPFGSMTLHPDSEVLFQPNGLILKQGKYRAFIHASPRGFQFRIPQATIGIRGTIFTATGAGGVAVDTGKVEVTPDGEAPRPVEAGSAWNMPDGDTNEGMPKVLETIEAALKAEHDKEYDEAAACLLDVLQSPALGDLPGYRDHLARKVLYNLAAAGSVGKDLLERAGQIIGSSNEAWYGVMEDFLRNGAVDSVKALLALAPIVRAGQPGDPRDEIIRGLVEDFDGNQAGVRQAAEAARNSAGQSEQWGRFWGHSQTYLQIRGGLTDVAPARITQMVSPAGMLGLSAGVARRRVQAVSGLPYGVLEAQGLYYLVRAYAAAGDQESVDKVMAFFEKNFPGTPWLARAREMAARMEKAAAVKAAAKRDMLKAGSMSGTRSKSPDSRSESAPRPLFEGPAAGDEASGKTASPSKPIRSDGVPATAADSIQQAY